NALEATASVHNDGFLPLDELSEADARDIGQVVYMIGNNSGKARMSQHAKLTKRIDWRVVVLSSGERGLEDHLRTAGGRVHGGQQVRFIEIEADAGKGLGCFDTIHGETNADSFARRLGDASKRCYGALIREFLVLLAFCRDAASDRIEEVHQEVFAELLTGAKTTPGEVSRVARKFAR